MPVCPSCQSEAAWMFQTTDMNRRISDETFDYYRCGTCGLVFLYPIPSDLGRYYPNDYYTIPASIEELTRQIEPSHYKIELVQKFVSTGRLLEIGPACGDFAHHAKGSGFEVDTIEMDARCCDFLETVVGVHAIHSDDPVAEMQEMAAGTYDVIALWQVIEHVPDFGPTLEAAATLLAPGGVLVLAAPNPDAFQFRLLRANWTHVDAPRHVALIPASLLERRGRELGLEPALVTTCDAGTLMWNRFGWDFSLVHLAKGRLARAVLRRAGGIATFFAAPFERRGRQGSTYVVVLQKPK